jgi:hypothetical protein
VKDVTKIRTSFCASSKIGVSNYSNKHITVKLIKEREKISEGGECVFICETALGAALYVLHRNLPNEFPKRQHKPIYRTAE